MKYIFSILALLIGLSSTAQTKIKYAPNRTSGDVIVTDVAWRAGEFLQIPTTTLQTPSIGSYVDSTGRIFYSRFDSTLLIRNNGTWFRYFNSNKINSLDALVVHLAGTETITGAKTFNGNNIFNGTTTVGNDIIWNNATGFGLRAQDGTRYLSYTPTFGAYMPKLMIGNQVNLAGAPQLAITGKIRATDSIISQTGIRLTNDLVWNTDGGFGLRASDGVRFLYYTTALGNVSTTLRVGGTTIQNGNPQLTVQGKAFITDSLNGANANFTGTTRTSKLIGNSSVPSVSLGANITGSVSVTGTDLAGTITVTVTGISSLATLNELFTLTYNSAYSSTPHVVWSPASANAAALLQAAGGLYLKNSGTSSFQIATVNSYTTPASATYSFTYQVIQ